MERGNALVTGASGEGIGRCAARSLRAAGFRVWAGARRPEAMDAAASPRQKTRYRVGLQASALVRLQHLVPDPLWDAAMRRLLGV